MITVSMLSCNKVRLAECEATDRDIADGQKLDWFAQLVEEFLAAAILEGEDLRHPDICWQPEDIIKDIEGHLKSIRAEIERLHGPLVLEE